MIGIENITKQTSGQDMTTTKGVEQGKSKEVVEAGRDNNDEVDDDEKELEASVVLLELEEKKVEEIDLNKKQKLSRELVAAEAVSKEKAVVEEEVVKEQQVLLESDGDEGIEEGIIQNYCYCWNRMIWRSPFIIKTIRICKLPIIKMFVYMIWILIRIVLLLYSNNSNHIIDSTPITTRETTSTITTSTISSLQITTQLFLALEQNALKLFTQSGTEQQISIYPYTNVSNIFILIIYFCMKLLFILVQDMIVLSIFSYMYRIIYCCMNSSIRNDIIDNIKHTLYLFATTYIPSLHQKIYIAGENFRNNDIPNLLKKDTNRIIRSIIPNYSILHDDIITELNTFATTENIDIYRGQISGTVYNRYDKQHHDLMTHVYGLYSYSNPLHPGYWPKVNQCEGEVISMINHMLHGPNPENAYGCMTSGGTESILLSIRAHYIKYGKLRGILYPEIICLSSAHAALDKACDIYHNIRKIVIPVCANNHYTFNINDIISYISSNTIMIYASTPCYPLGVVDPISELSNIAIQYDIGLHVDACLGGFVLAFYDDNYNNSNKNDHLTTTKKISSTVPPIFDFRNVGVTSISIDTHKYGYSTKGTSVILYRNETLRHCQYFSYPHWTGGLYHTPTFAGSRSGGIIICAWASLLAIGIEEYKQRSYDIVTAARTLGYAIYNDISELELFVKHPNELYVVVSIKISKQYHNILNIYKVSEYMKNDYGWNMNSLQFPPAIHICITLSIVQRGINELIDNLKNTIIKMKKEAITSSLKKVIKSDNDDNNVGIYGTSGATPTGPLTHLLNIFTDESLSP